MIEMFIRIKMIEIESQCVNAIIILCKLHFNDVYKKAFIWLWLTLFKSLIIYKKQWIQICPNSGSSTRCMNLFLLFHTERLDIGWKPLLKRFDCINTKNYPSSKQWMTDHLSLVIASIECLNWTCIFRLLLNEN